MKLAIIFDRFGPYHIARLEAAAKYLEIIPIEVSGETSEYQWDKVESSALSTRITLFDNVESSRVPPRVLAQVLFKHLDKIKPDVIAINGWFDRSALAALYWCLKNKKHAVVMSDSTAIDVQRVWWREKLKSVIVGKFSAGLVAGSRHHSYLASLGMDSNKIFTGYDVVDNQYFEKETAKIKAEERFWRRNKGLPENYFLVVSRFIEKKNIPFIIKAYQKYVATNPDKAWKLVIIGDGPLKNQLQDQVKELKLSDKIIFEGFKQYDELPVYFGLASAFIHASTSEQWGLVVNEAMASGLPVVISDRCGCVPELVKPGVNGFSINPENEIELTEKMLTLTDNCKRLIEMGLESRKIVSALNPDVFGQNLLNASKTALQSPLKKMDLSIKLILRSLIYR